MGQNTRHCGAARLARSGWTSFHIAVYYPTHTLVPLAHKYLTAQDVTQTTPL